jgi:NAD(P)H-dependent FMN reductase
VLKLEIIVGSTRSTGSADVVVPWVERRARQRDGFDVEVLDLRSWPLPMFAEHPGTIDDFRDPSYSDPIVKAWNAKIKRGEAYLVVTGRAPGDTLRTKRCVLPGSPGPVRAAPGTGAWAG